MTGNNLLTGQTPYIYIAFEALIFYTHFLRRTFIEQLSSFADEDIFNCFH